MKYNDFDKIERFSYFLPYGYISPLALELSIPSESNYYCTFYDSATTMDERIAFVQQEHRKRVEAIYAMQKYGYIEKIRRKVDTRSGTEISLFRLTRSGFYVLTGTYDAELEKARIQESGGEPTRIRNGMSYQYDSQSDLEELIGLNCLAHFLKCTDTPMDLDEQIFERELSILSSELVAAQKVKMALSIKGDELYRNTRLANVNALFKANGFMTQIDTLPMDCIIPTLDIHDDSNSSKLTIESFTMSVLEQWRSRNHYSVRFTHPDPITTQSQFEDWYNTPVFYPLSIIPGFSPYEKEAEFVYRKIGNNRYHHTAIGLAAGATANYLVYHTHPHKADWRPTLEGNTRQSLVRALQQGYGTYQHPHLDKNNNYALMICPTTHQFKALFQNVKKRMGKKKGRNRKVAEPFDALCIIPVNHAGAAQINMLMKSNPIVEEDRIKYNLKYGQYGFTSNLNSLFPLFYHQIPVFIGYLMNFQRLFDALEYYEAGLRFYVLCFPEQVPFIRSIMPNVEFL